MPSSYSRSSYHYRPPPPPPPSYQYQTLYHSAPADIDIGAILTTVGAAVVVIYLALGQYVALPTPLDAIAAMAGALFGPEYREKLQNAFAKTPGQVVSQAASIVGIAPTAVEGGVVGGLWNVGNTCYQNSVLQSLASLGALKPWLAAIGDGVAATTLHELVDSLNMVSERKRVETASSLITARGWMRNEQQDAQEYLQGLMGVLEKEVLAVEKLRKQAAALGLEHILEGQERPVEVAQPNAALRSPFEGLLAQRVGCLKCGYVDSISLQPFTTLSLPIPERVWRTSLENCIHAFTAIEKIEGVHCEKCTLLSIRDGLQTLLTLLPPSEDTPSTTEIETEPLPDAFRDIATERLNAINQALEDDNFTPKIAGVNLDGPRKVLSTKTKQVMIARAPPVLVLHANRSQFDLFTGVAGKNHAAINFPLILDLAQLGAVTRHEEISVRPGMPISPPPVEDASGEATYELKAVVVHYGGHHNGHYVAYRRWAGRWWRISDHEVVQQEEEQILAVNNAFMLFYERIDPSQLPSPLTKEEQEQEEEQEEEEEEEEEEEAKEEETPSRPEDEPVQPTPPLLSSPTPEPPQPDDDLEDVEEVPDLTRDVSSRDSSPETPPPLGVIQLPRASRKKRSGGGKERRKGRK